MRHRHAAPSRSRWHLRGLRGGSAQAIHPAILEAAGRCALRPFEGIARKRWTQGSRQLIFATNAGMFDPTYKPVGLYVENGKERGGASTRAGWGNFRSMKPNGVFFVAGDKAGVLETARLSQTTVAP